MFCDFQEIFFLNLRSNTTRPWRIKLIYIRRLRRHRNLRSKYHYAKHNTTAKQYHSPLANKTEPQASRLNINKTYKKNRIFYI